MSTHRTAIGMLRATGIGTNTYYGSPMPAAKASALWIAICRAAGLPTSASVDRVHERYGGVVGRGSIQRLREGNAAPRFSTLLKMADHLNVDVQSLIADVAGDIPRLSGGSVREPPGPYHAGSPHLERLRVREWLKTSRGGGLVADHAARAEGVDLGYVELIEPADGVYAVRVRGDGLTPAIDDGTVLILAPRLAPEATDRVVISLNDGSRWCKKLLHWTDDALLTSDLATQEQRTFYRSEVTSVHVVLAQYGPRSWRQGPHQGRKTS